MKKALHWADIHINSAKALRGRPKRLQYSSLFFHPRASRMRGVFSSLRRLQSRTKGTLQGHVDSGGALNEEVLYGD